MESIAREEYYYAVWERATLASPLTFLYQNSKDFPRQAITVEIGAGKGKEWNALHVLATMTSVQERPSFLRMISVC